MKNSLLLILLLFAAGLKAQFITEQIANAERKGFHLHGDGRGGAVSNANVIYARLQLNVNPNVNYVSGKVTTVFIPENSISFIQFDLSDSMQVDSVYYHGASVPFLRGGGDVLNIPFPVAPNTRDSVAVFYQGRPDNSGLGSFTQSKHGPDSVPVIWTLSEPYGAKDWWPCKQNLNDKYDSVDVVVTTPDSFKVASNGLLVAETQAGSNKVFCWKHRYPIAAYLVCLAATNYAVYTDYVPYNGDTVPVVNYMYPENLAEAQQVTPLVIRDMQVFDSLFGVYPFNKEKYGHAQFGWGGGMEHQTMTFMGGFDFELFAHELAHHWFGDKVTCASWHDIWLNESFATYLTGLCYEFIAPQYSVSFRETRNFFITKEPGGSVYCYDTTNVSRIFDGRLSYSKGCMVLNMLRRVIGDTAFFAGIKNYVNAAGYGFSTTDYFKSHMEATSGKDLGDFFTKWIYKEGFPSYQLTWSQNFDGTANLVLNQTQSHPSVSFYPLPVPVLFKGIGRDTMIILDHIASGQAFMVALPFVADTAIIDPESQLLSANNTVTRNGAYGFSMLLYPNPVNDLLHMRFDANEAREADIMVFSGLGQMVAREVRTFQPGSTVVKINTSNFAAGTYRVVIESLEKTYLASFIKVNK